MRLACPEGYRPHADVMAWATAVAAETGGSVRVLDDPAEAVAGAHAVYTDVFVSMGEEDVREAKLAVLGRYQVDETLMARARPDAVFMHCLPAHRGEEVTDGVLEGPAVGRLRPGREPAPHGRRRAGDAHQPVAARTMRAMSVRESVPVQSVEETDAIGLDRAALVQMYRDMLLTRGLEDRGTSLFKQGKLPGSFYTGRGNEAASVGVASAMGPGDVGAPLHRNMGVHVARGAEPWRLLCQYMGRDGGATRGRDSNLRSQDLAKGLIAGVSHLPGILPTALGVALAFRITGRRTWRSAGSATAPRRAATCTSA